MYHRVKSACPFDRRSGGPKSNLATGTELQKLKPLAVRPTLLMGVFRKMPELLSENSLSILTSFLTYHPFCHSNRGRLTINAVCVRQ